MTESMVEDIAQAWRGELERYGRHRTGCAACPMMPRPWLSDDADWCDCGLAAALAEGTQAMRLPNDIEREIRTIEAVYAARPGQHAGNPRLRGLRSAVERFAARLFQESNEWRCADREKVATIAALECRVGEADARCQELAQEHARLREHILRRGWWQESGAPCVLCGYEGEGYYQPATHECARLAAALAEVKPSHD